MIYIIIASPCHAPFTSRLISLISVDTKEEEREFSTINAISKTTSNGHPEHIIPNCIVHIQAERKFKSTRSSFLEQQSKIGKFASNLPQFPDTVIPCELLDNELYHAHLEAISDFLLCGKGVWWHVHEDGMEKDGQNFKTKAPLCTTFVLLPLRVNTTTLRQSGKSA